MGILDRAWNNGSGYGMDLMGRKSVSTTFTQAIVGTLAGRVGRGVDLRINQLTGRLQHINKLLGDSHTLSTALQNTIRNTSLIGARIGVVSGSVGNTIKHLPSRQAMILLLTLISVQACGRRCWKRRRKRLLPRAPRDS